MTEGGQQAVQSDDQVVPASDVRRLEERVRELERLLGRKTLEVEILKEALELARWRPGGRLRIGRRRAWGFVWSGLAKNLSTALSQEAEVGVKWNVQRG